MSISVFGTNVEMAIGSNASTTTVNGGYAIKVGTSKNSGTMAITVPATSINLHYTLPHGIMHNQQKY